MRYREVEGAAAAWGAIGSNRHAAPCGLAKGLVGLPGRQEEHNFLPEMRRASAALSGHEVMAGILPPAVDIVEVLRSRSHGGHRSAVVLLFVERLARFGVSVSLLRTSVVLAALAVSRGQRWRGGGRGGGSGVGVPYIQNPKYPKTGEEKEVRDGHGTGARHGCIHGR